MTTPGIIPRARADRTILVPDLGITCGPPVDIRALAEPVILIGLLSPSNETQFCLNIWAYTTIPTVAEIGTLFTSSIGGEILRRQPDGNWPDRPEQLGPHDHLRLDTIGFDQPLRAAYRTTLFWSE